MHGGKFKHTIFLEFPNASLNKKTYRELEKKTGNIQEI